MMRRFINNNIGNLNRDSVDGQYMKRLNQIYNYLSKGMDYNDIIESIPGLTEDELNSSLWYLASKGLRYVPTLS